MKPASPSHSCPVCGFARLAEAPRSPSGGASYEICPCCGFQFGYDDDARGVTYLTHREQWIQGGLKWWSRGQPAPANWDPQAQLAALYRVESDLRR